MTLFIVSKLFIFHKTVANLSGHMNEFISLLQMSAGGKELNHTFIKYPSFCCKYWHIIFAHCSFTSRFISLYLFTGISSMTAHYEPQLPVELSSMTNPWWPSTKFRTPTSSNLPPYQPFTILHCPSFKSEIHDCAGIFINYAFFVNVQWLVKLEQFLKYLILHSPYSYTGHLPFKDVQL